MLTPVGCATHSPCIKAVVGRRWSSIQNYEVAYIVVEAGWHLQPGC